VVGRGVTVVGSDGLFMASSHVAHDCIVGNNVVLANCAGLGGHVQMADFVFMGGLAAAHQFSRIGRYSFIGGLSAVTKDVIPFGSVWGNHAHLEGLNLVGLKRRGVPRAAIAELKRAFHGVYFTPGNIREVAARMLAERLRPGSAVLVVGTDALAAEITAVGLRPVRLFDEQPVAVVQGLSMTIGWPELAEAALAIRSGALWVTANLDQTLPTERGLLPGNGSLVAALRAATGAEPLVAGKPAPQLMRDALARGEFDTPLVVGDRLDTDIAGGAAAGLPSLMVLSGVSTARQAARAPAGSRPTYIGTDLRALNQDSAGVAIGEQPAWEVSVDSGAVTVSSKGMNPGEDGLSVVRATAWALWSTEDPATARVRAGDDVAAAALRRWDLLGGADWLA
jgi:ribonucleotide monophosphatase NagD (HAD superfamily)